MNHAQLRDVFNVFRGDFGLSFDVETANNLFDNLESESDIQGCMIDGQEFRLIRESDIDQIMEEELDADHYMLGCCCPWFIADITGLDTDEVEKAQKADSMEVLGALMAKDLELVQQRMAAEDGYGHYFNHYDGNETEAGGWYIFRTN